MLLVGSALTSDKIDLKSWEGFHLIYRVEAERICTNVRQILMLTIKVRFVFLLSLIFFGRYTMDQRIEMSTVEIIKYVKTINA